MQRNPARARFLLIGRDTAVRAGAASELRALNSGFFATVTAWLRPRIDSGEVVEAPFEIIYALWLGPCQELSRLWLGGDAPAPTDDIGDLLARAAVRSLTGGSPG